MSATATDIEAILQKSEQEPPRECHTIDDRGWAICGAFGPSFDEDGNRISNLHTRKQCIARGHRHCVPCLELGRQLGDDNVMMG
jgi:hypothetical protein